MPSIKEISGEGPCTPHPSWLFNGFNYQTGLGQTLLLVLKFPPLISYIEMFLSCTWLPPPPPLHLMVNGRSDLNSWTFLGTQTYHWDIVLMVPRMKGHVMCSRYLLLAFKQFRKWVKRSLQHFFDRMLFRVAFKYQAIVQDQFNCPVIVKKDFKKSCLHPGTCHMG